MIRTTMAPLLAAAALLLGGAGAVAYAYTSHGPAPRNPVVVEQPADGPDVPGMPDTPEPGDVPDAPR